MGSSPVSEGKGVYNKGSSSLQLFFEETQDYFQTGAEGNWRCGK